MDQAAKNGPFDIGRMRNLRERVEHIAPRIRAHTVASRMYFEIEAGLGALLLRTAWPALAASAAEFEGRKQDFLASLLIVSEDEPCLESIDDGGHSTFLRGEAAIAAALDRRSVYDVAEAIDGILRRWEVEMEGTQSLDGWDKETSAVREVRKALEPAESKTLTEVGASLPVEKRGGKSAKAAVAS